MTDEQKNIEIAKLCGWTNIKHTGGNGVFRSVGDPPNGRYHHLIPNYTSDLNACAEMEKQAPERYADQLRKIVAVEVGIAPWDLCDFYLITATAHQRCDAFLEAMK